MKSTTLLTTFLATSLVAISSAFAGHYSESPDMQFSILNEHDNPAYVGTGLAMDRERTDPFDGAFAGNPDIDQSGFIKGTAGPEKGEGDQYGSVLYDVDALR
jgi:hypothetical protein